MPYAASHAGFTAFSLGFYVVSGLERHGAPNICSNVNPVIREIAFAKATDGLRLPVSIA
jgi:hypothetical protein